MDIFISKKMRNFILLVQTNNTARATEKIHMTASRLDKSIAALGKQIGYTLFIRKDNNISLNKAERELYQKLFPVYQRLSMIDDEIRNPGHRSRDIVMDIDNAHPIIVLDQLIGLGDRHGSVTAQPVESNTNGVIDNLFDRQLDFIISPQHISIRAQEPENLTISELPPLQLDFLVSRRYKERQKRELLQELPWLRVRFQNWANFKTITDANMRPCGVNPTIIYHPYSFMAKISGVERGRFLTVIPHFAWRLVNPATLKYFDTPRRPIYMQEYLYSIRNHRYTATMLQHIVEDRDGTNH